MNDLEKALKNQKIELLKQKINHKKYSVACITSKKSAEFLSFYKSICKIAKELNIEIQFFDSFANEDNIKKNIEECNKNKNIQGIVLEYPLQVENERTFIDLIDPNKDIESMTNVHQTNIFSNQKNHLLNATTSAVFSLMKDAKIDLTGKKVTIIGRGSVGRVIAFECLNQNATISVIHSKTSQEDKNHLLNSCDIIISSVGKHIFNKNLLDNPNKPIFDIGTNFENGKMFGDFIGFTENDKNYHYNFGSLTTVCLFENLIELQVKKRLLK